MTTDKHLGQISHFLTHVKFGGEADKMSESVLRVRLGTKPLMYFAGTVLGRLGD